MDVQLIHKYLLILSGILVLIGAFISFMGMLFESKTGNVRLWFKNCWTLIDSSNWFRLPIIVIAAIIKFKTQVIKLLKRDYGKREGDIIFILQPVLTFITIWHFYGIYKALLLLILFVPYGFWFYFLTTTEKNTYPKLRIKVKKFDSLGMLILFFLGITASIFLIKIALSTPLFISIIIMLFTMPSIYIVLIYFITFLPTLLLSRKHQDSFELKVEPHIITFSSSIGISFVITFSALLIGIYLSDNSYIPQTIQMLIINALFDGLTLLVTFGLLSWAIKKKPDFRIPIAILFDFIMASVFACASIYFGLIATEYALSIPQSINILFGKSIDGNSYVLGPYFWVMHTTFIPTAVYLFVIFISWLGKIFLVPIHWFFRVGISSSNPIILTGGLIGFIGALLGFLLLIIN